jgi:predicted HicB family RNase H-like nuclease
MKPKKPSKTLDRSMRVRISDEMLKLLKEKAKEQHFSASAYIRYLISREVGIWK